MPDTKTELLIVDDEPSIRMSMSLVLGEAGYCARSAEDGFAALHEIRKKAPEILISDLNMPGMSGFELLSVIRRRFPAMRTVAMSGSFSGDEVPSGVAADAFYPKGGSMRSLLRVIESLPQPDRVLPNRSQGAPGKSAPIWIHSSGHETCGVACVTISCPECLRTFLQPVGSSSSLIRETDCIFCRCSIHYAIVQSATQMPEQVYQTPPHEAKPAVLSQSY
jgi:CheY-like chemotaxis protein